MIALTVSRLTIYRQLMVADKETKKQIISNIPEYDLQHPGTMAHVGMLYVYRSFWPFCINLSTFVGSLISFIGMVKAVADPGGAKGAMAPPWPCKNRS